MQESSTRIARYRVVRFSLAALMAFVPACRPPPTEIVLVVDTNLSSAELDEVKITVGAPAEALDTSPTDAAFAGGKLFDLPLTDGGLTFPLTLGIQPSGPPGAVQVSVQALLAGNVVVEQSVGTSFIAGQSKLLEVQLLDRCVGITCVEGTTSQTCQAGTCQPTFRDGSLLPPWTGQLPPRPSASETVPIAGRTIWANGWHTCAIMGSLLYCWGRNSDGEIGNGATTNAKFAVPVMHTSDLAAVGLGQFTTCVCDRAGKAWCWGRNVEGELGTGSASVTSPIPVPVPDIDDCVQIAGGALHTCVVHKDGTVSCWGGNTDGQVGQPVSSAASCPQSTGSPTPCVKSPVVVPGLTDVAEVHAGETYTCARKNDMTVWCWGSNFSGTLGDGTNTMRSTPAPVNGLDDIVEIATGRWFACARHASGTVSCWGQNDTGQVGNGSTTDTNKPVAVVPITDAIQLGAGARHACVLGASGVVSCWGSNKEGELGQGTFANSVMPMDVLKSLRMPVDVLNPVNSIALGAIHTCAVPGTGSPVCWGDNDANEIGDTTKTPRPLPVSVAGFM
jgi:alpha-tubulin suppressor-like RCC1 family protein